MIDNTILSMCPGPEVIGEPYWCLMEWKNNKITGNFFYKQGFCFFLRSIDAIKFKKQFQNQHEWVVRGINKNLLNIIINKHKQIYGDLIPFLLVLPFYGGKKITTIKVNASELLYYANHGNFIDESTQKIIDIAFNYVKNPPPDSYTRSLCIDPFLSFLENNYQRYPRPYIQLPSIIKEYRNTIFTDADNINDEAKFISDNIDSDDQCYTRTFELPEKSSYEITWSIPKLKMAISKYNIPTTIFSVETIVPLVDQSNIVTGHLNKALLNSEPIIMVKYPLSSPSTCIVDGNHRVMAKHINGQKVIQGYLLEPKYHLEAMIYNVFRTLYKVHYNLNEILKYMSYENLSEKIELLPLNND